MRFHHASGVPVWSGGVAKSRSAGSSDVGALGGATVNYVFIEHFQDVARGHFIVRRLERAYGKDVVRTEYERLAQAA